MHTYNPVTARPYSNMAPYSSLPSHQSNHVNFNPQHMPPPAAPQTPGSPNHWPPRVTTAQGQSAQDPRDEAQQTSESAAAFAMSRRGYSQSNHHDPYAAESSHQAHAYREQQAYTRPSSPTTQARSDYGHPSWRDAQSAPHPMHRDHRLQHQRYSPDPMQSAYAYSDSGAYPAFEPRWNDGRSSAPTHMFQDPRMVETQYAHSDFGGYPTNDPGVDLFDQQNRDLPSSLGAVRDPIIKARQKSVHTKSVRTRE